MTMAQEHKSGYPKVRVPLWKQFYDFFYSFIEQREIIHQGELEIHWYAHQRGGYLEMGASLETQDVI